jgi:proline iminopeptidase
LWTVSSGAGPPLVLVHGGPGWWDMFDDLVPLLSDVYSVLRWDQRGCGRSSSSRGPYSLATAVADLEAVRAFYAFPAMTLLGHSFGALLALRYALAFPLRVERLVYLSGTGLGRDYVAAYRRAVSARLAPHNVGRLPPDSRERWLWQVSTGFADPSTAFANAERLTFQGFPVNREYAEAINRETETAARNTDTAWHSGPVGRSADAGLASACKALPVPVHIIHGDADLRPPEVTDSLLAALPNARRDIVTGAGHYPWIEQPATFRRLLTGRPS